MTTKCLIVDDEPAARAILSTYIQDCEQLELMGSCKHALEATELLRATTVDLLFLDINMPKLSGIQFYKTLKKPPPVIFTTAYAEYAVEGFEVEAVDYLLKPFSFERFLKAVNRVEGNWEKQLQSTTAPAFLLLKSDKKFHRVPLAAIYYLEAVGDYVKVHYDDHFLLVHDRFQQILDQLPAKEFIRIHKSHAISIHHFELIEGNRVQIRGKMLPIGATYRAKFMELVKSIGGQL